MKLWIAAAAASAAFGVAHAGEASCVAPVVAGDANVAAQVGALTQRAVEWAERSASHAIAAGAAPSAAQLAAARAVGVRNPERIRILVVERLEGPDDPLLSKAGARAGIVASSADGLTLGYAVFLRRGEAANPRLWRHEFRHVAQFEACGGIRPFLASHVGHLLQVGYERSPFELDAQAHE